MSQYSKYFTFITLFIISFASFPVFAGGQIIINNTALPGNVGISTSKNTTLLGPRCPIDNQNCNSFGIPNIQVIQADDNGSIWNAVGLSNKQSTRYQSGSPITSTPTMSENGLLISLKKLRNAANSIAQLQPNNLTNGQFGTIQWVNFIKNITNAQTMYGIVRVKVPVKTENSPAPSCACTLASGNDLSIGKSICGTTLSANSQIRVKGTLLIDFIACDTGAPLSNAVSNTPRLTINIPLHVNSTSYAMLNFDALTKLTGTSDCEANRTECVKKINTKLPFELISPPTLRAYQASKQTTLTQTVFNTLSPPEQLQLLIPSGYNEGWLNAFQALNISKSQWLALGFASPNYQGQFTEQDIVSEQFQDIPALAISGGKLTLASQVNISGLLYSVQKLSISQAQESQQFFNGNISVRDGFHIATAKTGGAILINNDPISYSQTSVLSGGNGQPIFKPYIHQKSRFKGYDDGSGSGSGSGSSPSQVDCIQEVGSGSGSGSGSFSQQIIFPCECIPPSPTPQDNGSGSDNPTPTNYYTYKRSSEMSPAGHEEVGEGSGSGSGSGGSVTVPNCEEPPLPQNPPGEPPTEPPTEPPIVPPTEPPPTTEPPIVPPTEEPPTSFTHPGPRWVEIRAR